MGRRQTVSFQCNKGEKRLFSQQVSSGHRRPWLKALERPLYLNAECALLLRQTCGKMSLNRKITPCDPVPLPPWPAYLYCKSGSVLAWLAADGAFFQKHRELSTVCTI